MFVWCDVHLLCCRCAGDGCKRLPTTVVLCCAGCAVPNVGVLATSSHFLGASRSSHKHMLLGCCLTLCSVLCCAVSCAGVTAASSWFLRASRSPSGTTPTSWWCTSNASTTSQVCCWLDFGGTGAGAGWASRANALRVWQGQQRDCCHTPSRQGVVMHGSHHLPSMRGPCLVMCRAMVLTCCWCIATLRALSGMTGSPDNLLDA